MLHNIVNEKFLNLFTIDEKFIIVFPYSIGVFFVIIIKFTKDFFFTERIKVKKLLIGKLFYYLILNPIGIHYFVYFPCCSLPDIWHYDYFLVYVIMNCYDIICQSLGVSLRGVFLHSHLIHLDDMCIVVYSYYQESYHLMQCEYNKIGIGDYRQQ